MGALSLLGILVACEAGPHGPRLDEKTRAEAAETADQVHDQLVAAGRATSERLERAADQTVEGAHQVADTLEAHAERAAEHIERRTDELTAAARDAAADAEAEMRRRSSAMLDDAEMRARAAARAAGDAVVAKAAEVGQAVQDQAVEIVDDATLLARVKANLLAAEGRLTLALDVDVHAGRVTLRGQVATQAARDGAVAVARATTGVVTVDDQLSVAAAESERPR
jgi:osmotically-inducible protein OsmY